MIKTKLLRERGRIWIAGFLVVQVLFGYSSFAQVNFAQAQPIIPDAIKSDQNASTGIAVPEYKGVDKSIKDYLCVPDESNLGTALYDCIGKIYRFGIAFGAIALVFFIVFAGYLYMAGGETGKQKGKTIFTTALTGMAIILSSFVLLNFINPDLVKIKPIQPPIFSASSLPKCVDVGFGENCVLPNGQVQVGAGVAGSPTEAQYKDLIVKYTKQYATAENKMDYCSLSALMQKESTFNYLSVSNGPPKLVDVNSANKQTYNITDFDSKYHAIGLTQVTIYEKRRGLTTGWTNGVPARGGKEFGVNKPLYVTDLINPEFSIQVGAYFWAAKMKQAKGDPYEAYRFYQGLGSETSTLNRYLEMYTSCKRRN